MAANGRVSPTANGFHEPIEVHEAANNDVNLNVFEMEALDEDENGNLDDDDALGLKNLFSDMPSNMDATRSVHAATIKKSSLRRRQSKLVKSNVSVRQDGSMELDAEEVADMLDDTDGNKMVKSMAAPMAQKKSVRRIHETRRKSAFEHGKRLSCWKSFQMTVAMQWKLFTGKTKEFFLSLELWRGPLKVIEGNFGNGVLSYFLFLKSLLFLNILIFLVEFGFVVIPQALRNYNHLIHFDDFNITSRIVNTSVCPAVNTNFYQNRSAGDHILDFFTGQGYINTTIMFYSNYDSVVLQSENGEYVYDMPLAYMLVGGAYFILSLFSMVKNLAHGFTESIIESGGFFYSYCNKVFASWDYCITNEKAVQLKQNCIYKDFEAELAEEKRLEKIKGRTRLDRFKIYMIRFAVSFIIMALLGGAIYAIILAVEVSTNTELTDDKTTFILVLKRWASSLTISGLNVLLPFCFEMLTKLEEWSPRVEVAMSLWRAVLLKLASVAVLVITLFTTYRKHECEQCWENQIGSQMFNLLFVDFFVTVGLTIVAETGRKYVSRYLNCGCQLGQFIGMQEFQIPKNVLDLVYGQSLIWIGTFFAPLIPVIGILKLIVLFYVKKTSLLYNCKPSSQPYQGARSNYFFTLLLLLTFLLCTVAVGWALTRIDTSCCGPFKNSLCADDYNMMGVITRTIDKFPAGLIEIVEFVKTTVFIFPLFIIIFLLLYYYHAMNKAHEKMISMLKDQLIMEGRDKRFLMDRLIRTSEQKKSMILTSARSTPMDTVLPAVSS